jgi:agmatinase
MDISTLRFADANASFDDASFVIMGIPFDRTTSFRPGARYAPNAIRISSYNFETLLFEHGIDLVDIPIHDAGDFEEVGTVDDMVDGVLKAAKKIVEAGKFPLFMGGEHSVTIPAVRSFDDIGVITIDAHLDYRESYLGLKNSHACVTRRISEHVGLDNVVVFGVRSISSDEVGDRMPKYIDAFTIREIGVEEAFRKALSLIKKDKIFFSLDIDGIDPAYAPGTGTPEPFGLSPYDVKKCLNIVAPKLVGFDISEVSPPYDNGNTAALAARMMREVIAVVWKQRSLR